MEVAAFHPPPLARRRLVSVALFLAFTDARAPAYSGRALPGILLCGARTFLSPSRGSGGLAGFGAQHSTARMLERLGGACACDRRPAHRLAGAQRHDDVVAERIGLRD